MQGEHYFDKQCYQRALEFDPTSAPAWSKLGSVGGGAVDGRTCTWQECYQKALEFDPTYVELNPELFIAPRARSRSATSAPDHDPLMRIKSL